MLEEHRTSATPERFQAQRSDVRYIQSRTQTALSENMDSAQAFAGRLMAFCAGLPKTLAHRITEEQEMLSMVSALERGIGMKQKLQRSPVTKVQMSSLYKGAAGEGVLHAFLSDYSKDAEADMELFYCDQTGTYTLDNGHIWVPPHDRYNAVFIPKSNPSNAVECDAVMINKEGTRLYAFDVTTSHYALQEKLGKDTDTKAGIIHRCVQQSSRPAPEIETHFFHVLLDSNQPKYEREFDRVSVIRLPLIKAVSRYVVPLEMWDIIQRPMDTTAINQCFAQIQPHTHKRQENGR